MANKFRTSNNVFRTQVQNYIIANLIKYSDGGIQPALQDTVDAFNNYDSPYNKRRIPNKQARFIDFLKGLPSELTVDFEYYYINKQLEAWFTACDQPYKPKDNYTDQFFYFIADNFERLCKKYGVEF